MKIEYKTIHGFGQDEIMINKSKFIGYSKPVKSEEEALEFIDEIKNKHKDATHNVYAYIVGEGGNTQRYSDDREPSGTAGIPILEVLKKEELVDLVVVVTRYFGGIKLGAGGLVRAYIKGAKIGLESSKIVKKMLYNKLKFRIEYAICGKVENELMMNEYEIIDKEYDDAVNITVICKKNESDKLISLITNMTSGNMEYKIIGEEYFSTINDEILK